MSIAKNHLFLEIELHEKEFLLFSGLMYELAGVSLPYTPKNVALVKNRLSKILRQHSLVDYRSYWQLLQKKDQSDLSDFISALTTNMTSFFREPSHFDWLGNYLKTEFKKADLRIWCAAASTGQEPYTIAMTVAQSLPESQHSKAKILSTDIDLEVLQKAARGFYTEHETKDLRADLLNKYFSNGVHKGQVGHFVKPELSKMMSFGQFNLMAERYNFRKPMDIIFCRNVLIYFDVETTAKVIDKLVRSLNPGGFLILGHSESGNIRHELLKPLSKAIYGRI